MRSTAPKGASSLHGLSHSSAVVRRWKFSTADGWMEALHALRMEECPGRSGFTVTLSGLLHTVHHTLSEGSDGDDPRCVSLSLSLTAAQVQCGMYGKLDLIFDKEVQGRDDASDCPMGLKSAQECYVDAIDDLAGVRSNTTVLMGLLKVEGKRCMSIGVHGVGGIGKEEKAAWKSIPLYCLPFVGDVHSPRALSSCTPQPELSLPASARGYSDQTPSMGPPASVEVFLSFSREEGDDAGVGSFAARLHDALRHRAVSVVAEGSARVCIPVISRSYAESRRCLVDLASVVRSGKAVKILPVFYRVDPSHVRRQKGHFEVAFKMHEVQSEERDVREWREALSEVGEIVGYVLSVGDDKREEKILKAWGLISKEIQ
ncbi:Disease resistance protein [Nymphaea thermarum]|nr:Disease resistance protein [Nymphaea thermarum]